MKNSKLRVLGVWIGGAVLVALAYRAWQWHGVALLITGIVFWLILHFTRMMQALKRTAHRPMGYIDSAVMLNAKLKQGSSLLHVVALTKSLGVLQSEKNTQPEVFRWTDNGHSFVDCTFVGGKLASWQLTRP